MCAVVDRGGCTLEHGKIDACCCLVLACLRFAFHGLLCGPFGFGCLAFGFFLFAFQAGLFCRGACLGFCACLAFCFLADFLLADDAFGFFLLLAEFFKLSSFFIAYPPKEFVFPILSCFP